MAKFSGLIFRDSGPIEPPRNALDRSVESGVSPRSPAGIHAQKSVPIRPQKCAFWRGGAMAKFSGLIFQDSDPIEPIRNTLDKSVESGVSLRRPARLNTPKSGPNCLQQ
jgi:hypothetical protein